MKVPFTVNWIGVLGEIIDRISNIFWWVITFLCILHLYTVYNRLDCDRLAVSLKTETYYAPSIGCLVKDWGKIK